MANFKPQNLATIDMPNAQAVSFDLEAFTSAVESQGVDLVHFRAMRCPVGMIDAYDHRRPLDDHSGCSNGFIYTKAGELRALFTGNSKSMNQQDVGLLDASKVNVTVPQFYDPSSCGGQTEKKIKVVPFDRFYLKDESITVVHWQLFEAHQTGYEKLSFPVCCVQDLMDNEGKRYTQGSDFEVVNGQIHWTSSSNRPYYDAELGKGQICSIRYEYRPYYYVSRMTHEVRVTQTEDFITGERKTILMPQAFSLVREYSFEREAFDPEGNMPPTPRTEKTPGTGDFGPR